jgi:hypothetical protein
LAAAIARTAESDLQSLILTLGARAGGTRHTIRLIAETGMPKTDVKHAQDTLHRLGMVDDHNRLTDEGWQELHRRQWGNADHNSYCTVPDQTSGASTV